MVFAGPELSRQLELATAASCRALIDARRRLQPSIGAEAIEVAGASVFFDGPDSPVTQTFGLGLHAPTTPADLDRIEAFFRERGAPTHHEVSPHAGVETYALLAERGYLPVEISNVLYRSIDTVAPGPDTEVEVRLIEPGEQELWAQTGARAWAMDAATEALLLDLGRACAAAPGALPFLATLKGQPIATAMLFLHGEVANFDGAATIPEARGRGAHTALFHARLAYSRAPGSLANVATITAQPGTASHRNAERHGFRVAYTRTKWKLAL